MQSAPYYLAFYFCRGDKMIIKQEDPLEIKKLEIEQKIIAHGEIPTKTNDTRCNKKHYIVNPRGNITRYGHKCDKGEMTTLRRQWNKHNDQYQKELKDINTKIAKRDEAEKLATEPLKILNETQKIKPEPEITKPAQINIYELPETKDYTKYFIIGGISIAILVIALIWSLR